jgi:hypothetical protein
MPSLPALVVAQCSSLPAIGSTFRAGSMHREKVAVREMVQAAASAAELEE